MYFYANLKFYVFRSRKGRSEILKFAYVLRKLSLLRFGEKERSQCIAVKILFYEKHRAIKVV